VLVVVTCIITPRGELFAATVDPARKIVIFVDGTTLAAQQLIVTLLGGKIIHVLSLINALAVRLPLGGLTTILQSLLSNPNVVGIYEDSVGILVPYTLLSTVYAVPEDFGWGQYHIGIPTVYNHGKGLQGSGVTVAVLDTGIDLNHPDLRWNIGGGFNAISEGKSSDDDNGHGTHIAGIIAASANGWGIIGTASQAKLMAVKVLDATGSGYLSDFVYGLQWVRNQGIRALNMSLSFAEDSVPLQRAIRRLYQAGAIMVAAAGNCGQAGGSVDESGGGDDGEGPSCDPSQNNTVLYPATYPEVIAVAATDNDNHITDYSRSGPEVAVAAPGGAKASERILSTAPGGGYALGSGTSQAAAHASGVVALALQSQPGLPFYWVVELLQSTAMDLGYPPERQGTGLIDAPKMMKSLYTDYNEDD
jgi:subtilisin family serine protease